MQAVGATARAPSVSCTTVGIRLRVAPAQPAMASRCRNAVHHSRKPFQACASGALPACLAPQVAAAPPAPLHTRRKWRALLAVASAYPNHTFLGNPVLNSCCRQRSHRLNAVNAHCPRRQVNSRRSRCTSFSEYLQVAAETPALLVCPQAQHKNLLARLAAGPPPPTPTTGRNRCVTRI